MNRFFIIVILFAVITTGFIIFLSNNFNFAENQDYNPEAIYFRTLIDKQEDYSYLISDSQLVFPSSRVFLITKSPEVDQKAKEIILDSDDDYSRAYKAYIFVRDIPYRETSYLQTPRETLSYGGDCGDKSLLYTSILDAMGIKSYILETEDNDFVTHSFNLVYINGKWIIIDVTNSFIFSDFSVGDVKLLYNSKEMRML